MSIFSTFLEVHFSGLKSILFYPEYQKIFLSGFFGSKKKHMKKTSTFWQKPWTNRFGKCRFFSTLVELNYWGLKGIVFYPEYQKIFLSGFFWSKKHIRKRSIFWQKPWTNPFAKCQYFLTLLELHFSGLKSIVFYPEYQKMFLSGFFFFKKTYEKKVDVWTKAMD